MNRLVKAINSIYLVGTDTSFLAESWSRFTSTSSAGSCTYLTTDPRIKQFFTES